MKAYARLLNESPSGYFSYERVDSTLGSSDTKVNTSCSWNNGTSSEFTNNYEIQTTQSVPSPVSSIDSTYGSWNVPKSRSPIPEDLWTCDLDFLYSLISPIPTTSIRSSTAECLLDINNNNNTEHSYPCFCSPCVQRESQKDYEEIRKNFESNGIDMEISGQEIQFSPDEGNCSTPSLNRKIFAELQNVPMQYFALVSEDTPVYYELENAKNCVEEKKQPKQSKGKKQKELLNDYCVFCFNNHECEAIYKSHTVKDTKGRTLCPKLRVYVCPICGKDGDEAHTTKYCKACKVITMEDTQRRGLQTRNRRNQGRQNVKPIVL